MPTGEGKPVRVARAEFGDIATFRGPGRPLARIAPGLARVRPSGAGFPTTVANQVLDVPRLADANGGVLPTLELI